MTKNLLRLIILMALVSTSVDLVAAQEWLELNDTDEGLQYNGDWDTVSIAAAYGGTLTYSTLPGSTLTVTFQGTAIEVLHSVGPDGGMVAGSVTTDGNEVAANDRSLQAESYSYQQFLRYEGLPDGTHTLTLTVVEGAVWIEGIRILGTLPGGGTDATPPPDATAAADGPVLAEAMTLVGHTADQLQVVFSPDGTRLASASASPNDTVVRVWEVRNGALLFALEGHTEGVNDIAWARDGSRLATGGEDSTVRLWDMADGAAMGVLYEANGTPIEGLAWSLDSSQLAVAAFNLVIVDARSGEITSRPSSVVASQVRWAPMTSFLATASRGNLEIWDPFTGGQGPTFQEPEEARGSISFVAWSPDGRRLLTFHEGAAHIWNADTGDLMRFFVMPAGEEVVGAAWGPDSGTILLAVVQTTSSQLRFIDAASGEQVDSLEINGLVSSVAWSSDGLYIAWADDANQVHLWPVQ